MFFANQGELPETDLERGRAVEWNIIHIQIVEELPASGDPVNDEDLAQASPVLRIFT